MKDFEIIETAEPITFDYVMNFIDNELSISKRDKHELKCLISDLLFNERRYILDKYSEKKKKFHNDIRDFKNFLNEIYPNIENYLE